MVLVKIRGFAPSFLFFNAFTIIFTHTLLTPLASCIRWPKPL